MKQVVLKGDDYEMDDPNYVDTAHDPDKLKPPPPDAPLPDDPDHYSKAPSYDVISVIKNPLPVETDDYVFCMGKPVLLEDVTFSKLTAEAIHREWPLDENGHLKGMTDDSQSFVELNVKAAKGCTFVFVGDKTLATKDGGVIGEGENYIYKDGQKEKSGDIEVTGKFTDCTSHVFVNE